MIQQLRVQQTRKFVIIYIIFQNDALFTYTGGYNHYVIATYLKYSTTKFSDYSLISIHNLIARAFYIYLKSDFMWL